MNREKATQVMLAVHTQKGVCGFTLVAETGQLIIKRQETTAIRHARLNPRKTTRRINSAKQRPRESVNESFKQARRSAEFITVEHLLLALLDDPAALKVLSACSANVEALRGDPAEFIDATTPMVSGMMRSRSQRWVSKGSSARCFPRTEFR